MTVRIIQGDVREELPKLPADSFDCIVTSPPYYGLRDYGTATWDGGDPACDHSQRSLVSPSSTLRNDGRAHTGPYDGEKAIVHKMPFNDTCAKCGARRIDAQIGIEPTLAEYLETIVAVCCELRRVLKPSGVFFLNIGDSYNGGGLGGGGGGHLTKPNANRNNQGFSRVTLKVPGLKPKDLCLVPERLGIALQADGWWVRSRIVWAKPNPMPESVTDRPTSAHETIWMLTKSERYFWDGDAVKEECSDNSHGSPNVNPGVKNIIRKDSGILGRWTSVEKSSGRNIRNVWSVASQPFPGAHFATMPPALVERCIKSACLPGCHVLDPFAGSGTVGLVADRLGRDATLIDLNTSYIDMATDRIRDDSPLFVDVVIEASA